MIPRIDVKERSDRSERGRPKGEVYDPQGWHMLSASVILKAGSPGRFKSVMLAAASPGRSDVRSN